MVKIKIESLEIKNFKGIKKMDINFGEKITEILGKNGIGKSTIADAISWLLWDKDSNGKANFEVRRLQNNKIIHKIDTVVQAVYVIDGKPLTIKKTLSENWVKKRGNETETLQGLESTYFFNSEVTPSKKSEYDKSIIALFDPFYYKILSDPLFFCTESNGKYGLKWEERRQLLFKFAKCPSNEELTNDPKFKDLISVIEGKDIISLRKDLAAKIKILKGNLFLIPARIEELENLNPQAQDWDTIEKNINFCNIELQKIEQEIIKKTSVSPVVQEKINQLQKLELQKQEIENNLILGYNNSNNLKVQKIEAIKGEIVIIQSQIKNATTNYDALIADIENYIKKRNELRANFMEIKKNIFNDFENENCPYSKAFCDFYAKAKKGKFEIEKEKFEAGKKNKLAEINKTGIETLEKQKAAENKISDYKLKIEELKASLNEKTLSLQQIEEQKIIKDEAIKNVEYIKISDEIELLKSELSNMQKFNIDILNTQKAEINCDLDTLKDQLRGRKSIEDVKKRIIEIEKEEAEINKEIAKLERIQFKLQEFELYKTNIMEENINSLFQITKFKLLKYNIDGEGETPCCEAIINGIEFNTNLNTGHKILAGLDVINVLKKYLQISVPIFIDNSESLTEDIFIDEQIILLKAVKNIDELTINK